MKKYEDALKELEELAQRMESGDFKIDTIKTDIDKARKLIKFCRDALTRTEEEINAIISQDNN